MRYRALIQTHAGQDRPRQCFFPDQPSAETWAREQLAGTSRVGLKAYIYETVERRVVELTNGIDPNGELSVFDTTGVKP